MKHYHLFMGTAQAAPMATTTYYDYDESIRNFLRLSKEIYGTFEPWKDSLSYSNVLEASEFGDGPAMTVGTTWLCIQWVGCRNPCMSPSWN